MPFEVPAPFVAAVPFPAALGGAATWVWNGDAVAAAAGPTSTSIGAQPRHRPSTSFQQFGQVYCRHSMQKLKVLWKASSWAFVDSRSVSIRAAAIASSNDVLSSRTKFLKPREITRAPRSRCLGAADSKVYREPHRSQNDSVKVSGIRLPVRVENAWVETTRTQPRV